MWMSGQQQHPHPVIIGQSGNQRHLGSSQSVMDPHPHLSAVVGAEPVTAGSGSAASTSVSATSAQPRIVPAPLVDPSTRSSASTRPGPVSLAHLSTHPGAGGPPMGVHTPNSVTSSTVYAASPSPADASSSSAYPSHYHHAGGHHSHSHSHSHSRSLSNTSSVTAAAAGPGPGVVPASSTTTPGPYGTRSTRAATAAGFNSNIAAGVKREPTDDTQGVNNGDYNNSNGHHVHNAQPSTGGLGGNTTTPRWSVSGPSESVEGDNSSAASPTSTTTGGGGGAGPQRKKQKRNKPTLSCFECVERKTKCDRGRPHCLACIKRQTECKYAHVANLLEETSRSAANGRRMTKPPRKKTNDHNTASSSSTTTVNNGSAHPIVLPNAADRGFSNGRIPLGSIATSTGLLSNVPFSAPGSSNVFGIGSEHPFANYWTCNGGLPEVIDVLPAKMQVDLVLDRYFECVDPVYPMIHRQTFFADYEHFWTMSLEEKHKCDSAFIALVFVMLALGTQFVESKLSAGEKKQTAEFYASAANQALRVGSYMSMASITSIQAMVLMTYFLINDNHASDGWAFGGILMRQAYAMGLHRDPNIVVPTAPLFIKQQRRKVWQAVLLQDTFLTVLLSLPPSATHTDVKVEDLVPNTSNPNDPSSSPISIDASDDPTDIAYLRGSWTLANLVQETICSPRSLDVPICTTVRHKSKLVADFRAVYRSFPDIFRSWDIAMLTSMAERNKRIVRQTLFLSSNYFHNLMLVHASESADVPVNVRGTLEAAHDAITAFFVLFSLFETEARVWWVFNHRAFLEALCIGNVLREVQKQAEAEGNGRGGGTGERGEDVLGKDPLFVRARGDIHQMINIMRAMSEGEQGSETARTRVQVLSEFL
ncbi:fungal-specific transcription factor domain-containing protein [Sordaria brevicollis]|uniref:Fungal-specific transcription factor domain-containing protein n=1 Tax=Sordaria brevicollis TaxID=83679 RepID=A0AAE0PF88_SORBR|nr:fungal-specific transcription factor domain-containing protein [Sordaria brevicollis]